MNIQQYYRVTANTSLNGSLASLFPIIFLILPTYLLMSKKEMLLFAIPFLLYSFLSYQFYLINQARFTQSASCSSENPSLSLPQGNHTLLTFLPAPSLRVLFFNPDGRACGEIRDLRFKRVRWFLPYFIDKRLPAEYGFFDEDHELLATFKWETRSALVKDKQNNLVLSIDVKGSRLFRLTTMDGITFIKIKSESLISDIQFITEGNGVVGRVRKGWMPLEWGKYFVDANTPVLTLDGHLSKEEKLGILALFIKQYRYYNH